MSKLSLQKTEGIRICHPGIIIKVKPQLDSATSKKSTGTPTHQGYIRQPHRAEQVARIDSRIAGMNTAKGPAPIFTSLMRVQTLLLYTNNLAEPSK